MSRKVKICQIEGCLKQTHNWNNLCSMHHMRKHVHGDAEIVTEHMLNNQRTTVERFWKKVDKSGDCWVWTASRCGSNKAYGRYKADGHTLAHRFSYELHFGPIPPKMSIHHKCRNTLCVRPEHLACVTQTVNNLEALAYKADHSKCLTMNDVAALVNHIRKEGSNG